MIRKGSRVIWGATRGNRVKTRTGEVVAVVAPFKLPNPKHRFSRRPAGLGRDHRSYVVRTDDWHLIWPELVESSGTRVA